MRLYRFLGDPHDTPLFNTPRKATITQHLKAMVKKSSHPKGIKIQKTSKTQTLKQAPLNRED